MFPHGQTVVRLRRKEILDPYSQQVTLGDWSDPDRLTIYGAFVAQSSTARTDSATRTEMLESKSLFCAPDADVQAFDRIEAGEAVYKIDGIPEADANPWTGWRPAREIPLERTV